MLNDVTLIGHIGKDAPEVKKISDKDEVANFSMATEDSYRDKTTGEKIKKTTWHNVQVWNKAKVVEILKPGMKITVKGSIQNDKYEKTIGGEKVTFHTSKVDAKKILILDSKK